MKISLNPEECIGCGVCNRVCPDIFGMEEARGVAVAKVLRSETEEACAKEAKESCPVGCIRVG